jgi:hypothetical protein
VSSLLIPGSRSQICRREWFALVGPCFVFGLYRSFSLLSSVSIWLLSSTDLSPLYNFSLSRFSSPAGEIFPSHSQANTCGRLPVRRPRQVDSFFSKFLRLCEQVLGEIPVLFLTHRIKRLEDSWFNLFSRDDFSNTSIRCSVKFL